MKQLFPADDSYNNGDTEWLHCPISAWLQAPNVSSTSLCSEIWTWAACIILQERKATGSRPPGPGWGLPQPGVWSTAPFPGSCVTLRGMVSPWALVVPWDEGPQRSCLHICHSSVQALCWTGWHGLSCGSLRPWGKTAWCTPTLQVPVKWLACGRCIERGRGWQFCPRQPASAPLSGICLLKGSALCLGSSSF